MYNHKTTCSQLSKPKTYKIEMTNKIILIKIEFIENRKSYINTTGD